MVCVVCAVCGQGLSSLADPKQGGKHSRLGFDAVFWRLGKKIRKKRYFPEERDKEKCSGGNTRFPITELKCLLAVLWKCGRAGVKESMIPLQKGLLWGDRAGILSKCQVILRWCCLLQLRLGVWMCQRDLQRGRE